MRSCLDGWAENRQLKSKLKWPKYIVMSVVTYGNVKLSGILVFMLPIHLLYCKT